MKMPRAQTPNPKVRVYTLVCMKDAVTLNTQDGSSKTQELNSNNNHNNNVNKEAFKQSVWMWSGPVGQC